MINDVTDSPPGNVRALAIIPVTSVKAASS